MLNTNNIRQVVLDTETTGLEVQNGHRIIEIGCVELVNRKVTGQRFHSFLNPQREIDAGATQVHGISQDDLRDKPGFADIAQAWIQFVTGAELIIHNAPFDVGFLNMELQACGMQSVSSFCPILDTLLMARQKHPGQRNSLDALCRRYEIDNSQRTLHGALLDAEILAEVYLAMSGGQVAFSFDAGADTQNSAPVYRLQGQRKPLKIIQACQEELAEHQAYLKLIESHCGGASVWTKIDEN